MHQYHENVLYRCVNVQPQSSCASSKCNAQLHAAGSAPHLGRFACFQVLALVGVLQDIGQHDSLHVCCGQLQQVVQALVLGLEGSQIASVLAQPHVNCVKQLCAICTNPGLDLTS